MSPPFQQADLRRAAQLLRTGHRLLVLAGAGLSADAGVPTFRGADGLWQQADACRLASAEGYRADPHQVWEWYRQRRSEVAGCRPHCGQRTLALLQRHLPYPGRVLIATTNEDDLLEEAGCQNVVHLHGRLFATRCSSPQCAWAADDHADSGLSFLPCPRCGAPVRPGSVWFGEPLDPQAIERIERFDADACMVVGSSSLVQPVASIPPELALAGRPVVEVNTAPTPLADLASVGLYGNACDILPHLVDLLTSPTIRQQTSGQDLGGAAVDA